MINLYSGLATGVLAIHAVFILWVICGAFVARSRPKLRWFHILCLVWGVLVEVLPWPCPLTLLENWLEANAHVAPYAGGFLMHYLDAFVYPDISALHLEIAGVAVCFLNLAIYARDWFRRRLK